MEEVEIIVDDFQETVSIVIDKTTEAGGVTKHSELALDDGTNPHGTTIDDVDDGTVAFKDEANVFTENQTITKVTPEVILINTSGGQKTAKVRNSGSQMELVIGSKIIKFDETEGFYSTSNGSIDLGRSTFKWKELFLSSFANVLGVKTVENNTNQLLRSDGSVLGITETANTSTIINLSNILGNLCNMASANATTTYTLTGTVTGGNARVLINAASEPTITGATNIKGSDFIISTDMYLVVFYNGNVTQFWFEEI